MGPRWPGITEEQDKIRKKKNAENSKRWRQKMLSLETPEQKEKRLKRLREKGKEKRRHVSVKTEEQEKKDLKNYLKKDQTKAKIEERRMQFRLAKQKERAKESEEKKEIRLQKRRNNRKFQVISELGHINFAKLTKETATKKKNTLKKYLEIYNIICSITETDPKIQKEVNEELARNINMLNDIIKNGNNWIEKTKEELLEEKNTREKIKEELEKEKKLKEQYNIPTN